MKHTLTVTIFLVAIYVMTQLVGLGLISMAHPSFVDETGTVQVETIQQVEQVQPEARGGHALLFILAGVAIGTALILVLMKYRKVKVWKAWYFLAIMFAINYALI
ncbi:hypothetical protein JW868_00410, partial [Candidatus Woesearchaeota archaeon]|nr:hypothetical protein [Candidatus Woesearchaeota archaeon]